jgi:hypothetical protein
MPSEDVVAKALSDLSGTVDDLARKIANAPGAWTPPAQPTLMAAVKEWAPIWAPFLAMLIPTLALVITALNFSGQITTLTNNTHTDLVALGGKLDSVNARIDGVGNRLTAVETTLKIQKPSP